MSQDQPLEKRIVKVAGARAKARVFPQHLDGDVASIEVLPPEEPGVARLRFLDARGQALGGGAVVCVPLADDASDADVRKALKSLSSV